MKINLIHWKKKIVLSLFLLVPSLIFAQGSIRGTVTDASTGEPLAGVNIVISGTQTGTPTDGNGEFELTNINAGTYNIEARYIGYETLTKIVAVVDGQVTTLNFEFSLANTLLDDVIVVAYGQTTKESFTGSANVIDQTSLKDVPKTSFQDALSGKAAGVSVTSGSGQAGSTPSIQIRGVGSMNASTQPLYVIDGVPVVAGSTGQLSDYIYATNNVMSTLNPNDIESISILKDASAASLYGSRAANGVVLITTKK